MKNKVLCDNFTLCETLRVARINKDKALADWCNRELKKRGFTYVENG